MLSVKNYDICLVLFINVLFIACTIFFAMQSWGDETCLTDWKYLMSVDFRIIIKNYIHLSTIKRAAILCIRSLILIVHCFCYVSPPIHLFRTHIDSIFLLFYVSQNYQAHWNQNGNGKRKLNSFIISTQTKNKKNDLKHLF